MKPRLRWLARLLVRGHNADFIRHDLDEIYARDRATGTSSVRAHVRYVRDLAASVLSIWRAALPRRVPGLDWLDIKLAFRMLVKNPGLTLVGGLALMIGIPVALAPVSLFSAINAPLPFRESHRIVGLQYWNVAKGDSFNATAHDFEAWQTSLTSFDSLAAARRRTENVVGNDGLADIARGAEMTPSAFTVVEVQPLLGRVLVERDQTKGTDPVVVIGYDFWQKYFHGDPAAVGQTMQFGRIRRTVVGIMPEGFKFPFRESYWKPFQLRGLDYTFGEGPRFLVFGRLRAGASMDLAQTEMRTVGQRLGADHPATHKDLRSDVVSYQQLATGLRANVATVYPAYVLSVLLLAVACGNIGTLVLARAAARSTEIAVRTALGAGRGRIVLQFFIESLVLSSLAAAAGLVLGQVAVTKFTFLSASMPFWFNLGVTPFTIAVAAGLAVFSAVIAGVLPALKATRRNVYHSLQQQGTGSAGMRFGRMATVLIVLEVAVAVGGLSGVSSISRRAFDRLTLGDEGAAPQEFLTAQLRLQDDTAAAMTPSERKGRIAAIEQEMTRRLTLEPGVRAVTFASAVPGMDHGADYVEIEGGRAGAPVAGAAVVRVARVEPEFFQTLGQPVAGRDFDQRDVRPGGRDVIVNRTFVDRVLRGRPAIGVRLRHYLNGPDKPPGPWHEIIGVVDDLGMSVADPAKGAGVYHVIAHGEYAPPQLLIRLGGDPASFVPRLRTIVNDIEPNLVVDRPARLDQVYSEKRLEAKIGATIFSLVAAIGVVLSAAGLYALMAFAVSQRTREIAIRIALGAGRSTIVRGVVARALIQLVVGVSLGVAIGASIVPEILGSAVQVANWRVMLAVVSSSMLVIGLLACVVPMRRALRIQPVQALKEQG